MMQTGSGQFNFVHAIMLILGVVLSHISVNLFNEYSDYKTGIDSNTERTPFSGGSGMIQSGLTKPKSVLSAAIATLLMGLAIGVYFCMKSHWILSVIVLMGGISIVFYTSHLAKLLLGELFSGLTLGSLVVIGTYISMSGNISGSIGDVLPLKIILISLPSGILTSLLLLLNEFPDLEADREGGRFHLVIWLGRKKTSYIYFSGLILVYILLAILPLTGIAPYWFLLGMITLPLALKAGITVVQNPDDTKKLIPAMGINVIVVLTTDALMALSFFIPVLIA